MSCPTDVDTHVADKEEAYSEYLEFSDSKPDTTVAEQNLAIGYNALISVVPTSMLKTCVLLNFEEIEHYTAKAILVSVVSEENEIVEQWLPMSACSNMDYEAKTVWVWDKLKLKSGVIGVPYAELN